jgi:hypothetical protein
MFIFGSSRRVLRCAALNSDDFHRDLDKRWSGRQAGYCQLRIMAMSPGMLPGQSTICTRSFGPQVGRCERASELPRYTNFVDEEICFLVAAPDVIRGHAFAAGSSTGRLAITWSTMPKSLAISAVRNVSRSTASSIFLTG